jgi:hypothetical protein
VVILAITTAACGLNNGCDQEIFNSLRVAMPPSARTLSESCVEGSAPGNAQYRATFTVPPSDLSVFQQNTSIQNWEQTVANDAVFNQEAAGLSSFQYGSYGDGALVEEALVDMSNPQEYQVYFYRAYVD